MTLFPLGLVLLLPNSRGVESVTISAVVFRLFQKPVNLTKKNGRLLVNLNSTFKPLFLINMCHCAHIIYTRNMCIGSSHNVGSHLEYHKTLKNARVSSSGFRFSPRIQHPCNIVIRYCNDTILLFVKLPYIVSIEVGHTCFVYTGQ